MQDRAQSDRPREKLAKKSAAALSDYELLMAIIGSGNKQADVTKIARDVRKLIRDKGSELTYEDLLTVKSLGPAKATNIMAGFELWRRQFEVTERPIIDSPEKAVGRFFTDDQWYGLRAVMVLTSIMGAVVITYIMQLILK